MALDFLMIRKKKSQSRYPRRDIIEIEPRFVIKKTTDLMIRGGDFYAIWQEELNTWSTDEQDAIRLIDQELDVYYHEHKEELEKVCDEVIVSHMWDAATGMIDRWHKYCQKQLRDNYHMLDEKLIFADDKVTKEDYSSKRLPYSLKEGDYPAYEKLISTLYSPEERHKLEWAIGSVVTGDSRYIQKFVVLYGSAGSGKSTVINLIDKLFSGYVCAFDAKALGSSNNAFALEYFKNSPLVALQHDGDLSRIEDNTRLNSLVSHEVMTVNEKNKSLYTNQFKCFLFMGTNKPVKITDAKSGIIRRLIDVSPTGDKLNTKEYFDTVRKMDFELGAIAYHCRDVYLKDPGCYDGYVPKTMLGATNDFYNFVFEEYFQFKESDGVSLKAAWEMYKNYCDDAKVSYPMPKRSFQEELKNYFCDFRERYTTDDGTRVRKYYIGFKHEKFEDEPNIEDEVSESKEDWLTFKNQSSVFDNDCSDCLAQYASDEGAPTKKWVNVTSKLSELDTTKLHYVQVPIYHIVVDLDIPDESGKKCFELNRKAAEQFPETYAELSKSGEGIHLHYIYTGDPNELSRVFADNIEIKVFTGNSSLRRKLTKNNGHYISTISSGLPLKKKGKKVLNKEYVRTEKSIRASVLKGLSKEVHPNTKPSIDFIDMVLKDAYDSGIDYDISDMRNAVMTLAMSSTHQKDYCLKRVAKMKFMSKNNEQKPRVIDEGCHILNMTEAPLVFFDCEVFPNLFLVNWKFEGEDAKIVRMINPSPEQIEKLFEYRLIGFNNRKYDNHILYARMMGYTNEQLYKLSQRIVSNDRDAFFREAYNVSYTDIYDFSAKKQSLKKFEIELGIHHKELGLPWDEPVPEKLWSKVAEYCDNDVIATEAVFHARYADFEARQTLAKIAGGTVNDTTNSLTTKLIFGSNRHPQDEAVYTDLSEMFPGYDSGFVPNRDGILYREHPATYRDEEPGEGGYVYAEPGMYENIALLDIASMHPHSLIALNLFGDRYTKRFEDLVQARLAVKHGDKEKLKTIFGGAFAEFADASEDELKNLASALKIAINSVYGLTSAKFDNPFKDPRNVDNIVAKRGALFMINLKHEVQERGFIVAHIKTDSIKIPNATPEIIQFVMDYGKKYGYTFEHEATYKKMCLVNDAVYIAKYSNDQSVNGKHAGEWTATGKQFQVPYVYKTLFSGEPIEFKDLCETRAATSSLYLDFNEDLPDVSEQEKELDKIQKKIKKIEADIYALEEYSKLSRNKDFSELIEYKGFDVTDFPSAIAQLRDERNALLQQTMPLMEDISKGHNHTFIGKVGSFCPVKAGVGGGLLMREQNGKYNSAAGCKGYRWMEAETVAEQKLQDKIDRSYFNALVDDAVTEISKYGDLEAFRS